ncbi:MAG: sulfatase [Planctomycetaceae bacterium]|nr:sulfatase [Planctomycetaceae bacterium]
MSRCFMLALICCLMVVATPHRGIAADHPNVVFFLVDDLGWTDLGCFGSSFYETPNVDRLAASGMRFTSAYAACPVCSPTRASIMTGKYPVRVGITDYIAPNGGNQPEQWKRKTPLLPASYSDRLAHEEVTLAEALKQHGNYATFFAGKWHLGPAGFYPEDQGFDVNRGGVEQGGPYGGKKYFSPYGNPRLADGPDGEHLPDRLASETVKFIEEHRDGPFLTYLSFYSVHTPLMARPDLEAKYKAKKKALGLEARWGQEGERQVRLVQEHAVYAGMVEAMDAAVGKVLDALDRLQLTENTIVVFMSDNGGLSTSEGHPTSNLPLRAGKGWMYEGGIREPMIVRFPPVTAAGTVCDQPVVSTDFYPTILELAGLPLQEQQHVDGRSFASQLRGQSRDRDAMFWHYPHYGNQGGSPSGCVREGDWKLIEFYEDGRFELYNLAQDIGETNNLAADEPARVKRMGKMLAEWRKETNAKMPSRNPGFSQQ